MIEGTPRPGRQLALALAACVGVAAIGATGALTLGGPRGATTSSRAAADATCPSVEPSAPPLPFEGGPLRAEPVALADEPTALALLPGGDGDGVLAERPGRLLRVDGGSVTDEVVLDLSEDTTDEGDGGLLGVVYDPDGAWLYVYRATKARDDVITAYPVDVPNLVHRGQPPYVFHRRIALGSFIIMLQLVLINLYKNEVTSVLPDPERDSQMKYYLLDFFSIDSF